MNLLKSDKGITFISVIFAVVMIGLMLAMAGQTWTQIARKEKEEELLFRGGQIFWAVSSWYTTKGRHPPVALRDIKDLLKDPRYIANVKHLRTLYKDPFTNEDFEIVKRPDGGVVGVKSKSELKPVKTANFDPWFKHFESKEKYSEWLFVPSSQRKLLPDLGNSTQNAAGTQSTSGGQQLAK